MTTLFEKAHKYTVSTASKVLPRSRSSSPKKQRDAEASPEDATKGGHHHPAWPVLEEGEHSKLNSDDEMAEKADVQDSGTLGSGTRVYS